jgi:uncharacterized DUF497 family protein
MEFEWDEEKRQANLENHAVDFRDIASVFRNPHLTYSSPTAGEKRRVAIGPLRPPDRPKSWSGPLVAVVYVRRGGAYRIISARRARKNERRAHEVLLG